MIPKISIIVPVYHPHKEYLERLLDSIVRQTIGIEQMEILMVVDGDKSLETREVLEEWERRYSDNIVLIFCDENRKPGYARTLGMSYASGEYIAFADQDDWLSLEMYQALYETAAIRQCEVVGSHYTRDLEYKRPEEGEAYTVYENRFVEIRSISDRKKFLMGNLYDGYWTAIYSKSFLEENNIFFPEGITYDDNFFGALVLFFVERYAVVDANFYHWYNNQESITLKKNANFYLDRLQIEMKKLEELQIRNLFSVYHNEIEALFFGTFYMNTLHIMFNILDEMPYQVYLYMAKTMRKLFPDYRKNYYIAEVMYKWCGFEVYPLLYGYYEDLGGKENVLDFLKGVPESLHTTTWFDTIAHPLSEEELVWWKMLYLLLPNS